MKRILMICLLLLLIPVTAHSTTYYMCGTGATCGTGWSDGSDSKNDGTSKLTPKLTLHGSYAVMSGGDTLIIGNGTYTGSLNRMNTDNSDTFPSVGTAEAWTIIKAENDGGVLIDGQNSANMFYSTLTTGAKYWRFEGIIWGRNLGANVLFQGLSYIKFLRCGFYDVANGNTVNFMASTGSSYILVEGCYAWGTGRYKFHTYHADHVIFRQCVGRPDGISAGTDPSAVFAVYSSSYVEVQNCIAIDADQTSGWVMANRQGSFFVPDTTGGSTYINFVNSIGLNVKLGGIQTAHNSGSASHDVTFKNIAIWDSSVSTGDLFVFIRSNNNTIQNCTFGSSEALNTAIGWDGSTGTMINNIFYAIHGSGGLVNPAPNTQDYNCLYANTNNTGFSGAHNITATNPLTNSLKYLLRIETGTTLSGAGSGGNDIGANILTLVGVSGTIWGETGYATDTETSMWPFPNESIIKSKMGAYTATGITGARGFAADTDNPRTSTGKTTLTSYIWEYLGNTDATAGLYDSEADVTAPSTSITTANSTIAVDSLTATGICADAVGVTGSKFRIGSAPNADNGTACTGTTSWSCATSGYTSGSNTLYVGCADAAGNWGSDTITVTYNPPATAQRTGVAASGVIFQ